jgi:hypothetical protein
MDLLALHKTWICGSVKRTALLVAGLLTCVTLLTSCGTDGETNPINTRYLDEHRSGEWVEQHVGAVTGARAEDLTQYPILSAFPRVFNPYTEICFEVPDSQHVWLWITRMEQSSESQATELNTGGAILVDPDGAPVIVFMAGYKTVGYHQVVWDGIDQVGNYVPGGVYRAFFVAGPYYDFMDLIAMWEPYTLIERSRIW